ncbi:MAG: 16S rRNA (cytosine(1402)-N(4))-methyltransferase RsmH [Patescibacteria group bacterium]|nr:16S rRNA (cytosine(1402)-N(4))-methyltransferase RsmH [Patescibacteria group bacterium]MCL5224442.1 16S rRNA (cytosine(1402)-N(4))-methyltransferase RsmH [Patescibacteria group bacterium]
MPHIPVLLDKALEALDVNQDDFIVDGTVDGGGHGLRIIERLGKQGIFLGIDRDKDMINKLRTQLAEIDKTGPRTLLVDASYSELPIILKKESLPKVDGLLLDLGFSSDQLASGRGFSFQGDEPLDMRYDRSKGMTAAEVISKLPESELADIFFNYSGERYSRRIAKNIVEARRREKILNTSQLSQIVSKSVPGYYERGRINPATRVFQALRIYVNDELTELQKILNNLKTVMAPGGRVVIISFHSLEDRIVKKGFQVLSKDGVARALVSKPVTAGEEETSRNPRSRSAKLRAIEII